MGEAGQTYIIGASFSLTPDTRQSAFTFRTQKILLIEIIEGKCKPEEAKDFSASTDKAKNILVQALRKPMLRNPYSVGTALRMRLRLSPVQA